MLFCFVFMESDVQILRKLLSFQSFIGNQRGSNKKQRMREKKWSEMYIFSTRKQRFEVSTEWLLRNQVFLFRGVAPCGYVNCSRSFEGKCRHHLQGYESILNHEDYGLTLLRNSGSNDTAITHTRSNKPEEVVLQYENRFAKSKICQSCVISIGYSDNLTATLAVSFAAVFSLSLIQRNSLAHVLRCRDFATNELY